MLPLQSLDSQSYEEIRDELFTQLKSRCPHWPIDHASDPARVFIELFSWLSEQAQFRLGQRSDDDIRCLYQSFGFHSMPPRGAGALCQFVLEDESSSGPRHVPAGTRLSCSAQRQEVIFQTTDDLSLHSSKLTHAFTVSQGHANEHDLTSPWQAFQSGDPAAFDLYFQDPLFQTLIGDGEITMAFADAHSARPAVNWRWELWHEQKWKGLRVVADVENLTLLLDPQLQMLPSPGNNKFPAGVLEQLNKEEWTIRARVPGKDSDLVTDNYQPQIWARRSNREVASGEQEDGDHCYSWSIQNIPEKASLGASIQALDLTEHPDLLASLEWVGSKQSLLIASLAEDQWMLEDPSRSQFSARHDTGEWRFYWQVPEDWEHEDEATLQLTLSYDYAPDGGAFVEVLAAHAEPLPTRLVSKVDTLSAVQSVEKCVVFDASKLTEEGQARDGLYLGFDSWGESQSASLYFELAESRSQSPASEPSLLWECWDGKAWQRVSVRDKSRGLSCSGLVHIDPCSSVAKDLLGQQCHWFRITLSSGTWLVPPRIQTVYPNVVWAVEGRRVDRECLGNGDGVASLSLRLKESNICAILAVFSVDANGQEHAWEPVSDFLESTPSDRHFIYDAERSTLIFGDGQRGEIPERGSQLFATYKVSAGELGHIESQRLQVLDPEKTLGFRGTNIHRSVGASLKEDLSTMLARTKGSIQPERAITVTDFERLAQSASGLVERASCTEQAGWIVVRLLPRRDVPWTRTLQDHVQDYLDERKILTTLCRVEGPLNREFSVEIRIRAGQGGDARVQNRFISAMNDYFDWWNGGVDGGGWSFGETLNAAACLRYLGDRGLAQGVLDLKFKVPGLPPSLELIMPDEALPRCASVKVVGI